MPYNCQDTIWSLQTTEQQWKLWSYLQLAITCMMSLARGVEANIITYGNLQDACFASLQCVAHLWMLSLPEPT